MYVKHPLAQDWPHFPKVMGIGTNQISQAWNMRTFLDAEAGGYKHATMLPPETITVEGHSYECYVVHVTSDDKGKQSSSDYRFDMTIWIDRKALVFRKKLEHGDGFMMFSKAIRLPMHSDTTSVYPVSDFDPQTTPEMFRFAPPADAKEVASLDPDFGPPPDMHPKGQMVGQLAPDVAFTGADGKKIALSSYRGKPVLLDFWAIWCGPCILSMPGLKRIYSDGKDKGLTVLAVDRDNEAETATLYLARHGYTWTDFHDTDKQVEKQFKGEGIPLVVLVDASGRIVYYDFGGDEAALRKAIAALGPEFASLAPADNGKPNSASPTGAPAPH